MKLLCFNDNRLGVLKDDRVVDVSGALPHWGIKRLQTHLEEVLADFSTYRRKFSEMVMRDPGVPLVTVSLLPPMPRPSKILAAFVNYRDRQGTSQMPIEFFYKSPTGIVGSGGMVELPDNEEVGVYHFEAELAYVIGKRAKHVNEADAMEYVFGYTPFIDVSARPAAGVQRRTQFMSKGQDTFAPIGPYLVTRDEVSDPHNLWVRLWVNEDLRQDYSTSDMVHLIPEQIAWLSRLVTLEPGDVIATGTHHRGLGPVNGGDTVTLEIEGLGQMKLQVKGYGLPKTAEWIPGEPLS